MILFPGMKNVKIYVLILDGMHQEPLRSLFNGQAADVVTSYKYFYTMFDQKLKFDLNTEVLCNKGQQCFLLLKFAIFWVVKALVTWEVRSMNMYL